MNNIYKHEKKIEIILTILSLYTFYNCCLHNLHLSEILFFIEESDHQSVGQQLIKYSSLLIIILSKRHLHILEHLFHKVAWINLTIYIVLTITHNYLYEILLYNGLNIAIIEMCILLLLKNPVTKAVNTFNWIIKKLYK